MSELKASVYTYFQKVWNDDNMDSENIVLVHNIFQSWFLVTSANEIIIDICKKICTAEIILLTC